MGRAPYGLKWFQPAGLQGLRSQIHFLCSQERFSTCRRLCGHLNQGQADLTNQKSGRDHKHLREMGFSARSKLTIASLLVFYCLNTTSGTQIGFSRPCTQDITVTQQSIRTYLLIAHALHKIYYAKLYLVFLQAAWQPVSWNNIIFTLK